MSHIAQWRQREVVAEISGKVAESMDLAAALVAQTAKNRAPRGRGIMAGEITHEVVAHGNEVVAYVGLPKKAKAFYAWFVEMGTSKMAARPFLRPSLYENARAILRILASGR